MKNTFIAKSLTDQYKQDVVTFLKDIQVNYTWSYTNMLRLDLDLVVHHLVIHLNAKPVKQKLRKIHPQISLLVKEDLQKMLDVVFISLIDYPEWFSSIV